ncbi:hypothetical protein AVL59_15455 [Streptomyces griseochromogenes]|nr:hypothetical protein AVL59_15455 [Streptomyces griseochromogenes]
MLVLNLNATTLSVALTDIARELKADTQALQWIFISYNLTAAALLLVAGAIGDRFGRKRVLLLGLAMFGLASLAGAWAPNAVALTGVRAVMGLGSAIVTPMSLSIIPTVFPEERRGRAIGIWSGSVAVGIPLGPIIGGYLLSEFWWGSIFLLNVVSVVITLAACAVLIPESRGEPSRMDLPGLVLSTTGTAALVYGLINAEHGWGSARTLGWICGGLILLAFFAGYELRTPRPLVQLGWFRSAALRGALVALVFLFFAMAGMSFVVPLYLEGVLGYGPMATGVLLTPLAITLVAASFLSSSVVASVGGRNTVVTGLVTMGAGFAVAALVTPHSGPSPVVVAELLIGFGVGLASPPSMNIAVGSLPSGKVGSGSGLFNAFRQLGGVFGVAVVGAVVSAGYAHRTAAASAGLPASSAESVRASVANVRPVASALGGESGRRMREEAFQAFATSMSLGLLISAGIALAAAVLAVTWIPGRSTGPDM